MELARRPPASLSSLNDILASLSSLQSDESELSASLAALVASNQPILHALARLNHLSPTLEGLRHDAALLSSKVSVTAQTAHRVGGSVRALDEEMHRVRDAQDRVTAVTELKSSLVALHSSMASQDWESAARHCSRAMSVPPQVISGPFAESAVPTAELPLPPAQTLQNAREELLAVFRRQFDLASQARDAAATTRFFKLFPAIGWEAEGLEAYASFVVDLLQTRAPPGSKSSNPLYFITSLTALFESVAMIVDQHQPVVEKYYGPGKMLIVVRRLLQECDRVVSSVIDQWEEERAMKRKISDVANMIASNTRRATPQGITDEDIVDPREIDKVLSEAAGMSGRWNLFRRFIFERLSDVPEDDGGKRNADLPDEAAASQTALAENDIVDASECRKTFEQLLSNYYTPLELWYLHTVINKAHRLSSQDPSVSPPTTTTPDDVFYILKLVLSRLLSTGSVSVVQRTVEQVRDGLERDYSSVMKRKLDDVYRSGGNQGGPGTRGEKTERDSRQGFIILLNDLDVSSLHMDRLVKDILASTTIAQAFLASEVDTVKEATTTLFSLAPKFHSILRAGVEQLFNQLMRPRLRTLITDVYKDVTYVLDEEAYASAEYNDTVRKRFVRVWEGLTDGYRDTFTENNFRLFFGLAVDVLVRPWEKFVMGLRFTELGAIRFDHDIRAIATYLSSQTAFGDAREKFQRLSQMSTLLNLDSEDDVEEFYTGSGIAWKLNSNEAKAVIALRV